MALSVNPLAGAVFDLSDRTKIRLTGEDRDRYLNGQITNDLRKADDSAAIAACILNAKGKTDAHIYVHRDGDALVVDAEAELSEFLPQRLERYIIADDVQIEDLTGQ